MVSGFQVRPEREVAHALAVIGLVAQRCDDPVVPAQLLEVHMQSFFAAPVLGLLPMPLPVPVAQRRPPAPPGTLSSSPLHRLLLNRPPRLDLFLHLIEQVFPLLGAGVDHQNSLLLLAATAPVQAQPPQVHLCVGFAESGLELKAELISLLVLSMKRVPHVQNLPTSFGGVHWVQRPGIQQFVGATWVELDVEGSPRLWGPQGFPKYP